MDNIASVRKPIGLSDAVQAIEEMCNNRAAYAHGGVRVQPIVLELGAGNGQTVFLRYVTDMLKAHKIRHFGGLDHYLEFVTDGTLEQLKEMFADIRSAAVYTNFYEGVVAIDITALGRVITEKQMRYFLSEILKVAQYATIIFYISPEAARNRKEVDQLVEKVMSAFNYKIQLIEVKPYTHAEFAEMVAYNIDDRGVAIEDDGHFMDAMETIVAYHTPKLAREAEDLAEEIIKRADYSHFVATINTDRLRDAFPVAFVDERGNVNAK